ncbi:DUF3883 domain-containing protein [Streptomyces sp. NPDC004562]|uniref:DUF3883 domain-containing protein n=1 Tax=Streptomyces sp. NPDC004562 TaxID=3364703 RepID=UPI003698F87B
MFLSHPRLRDLTPTQYGAALDWLRREGILQSAGSTPAALSGKLAGLAVLRAAVAGAEPTWLLDADRTIRSAHDLPLDVVSAAEALGLGANDAVQVIKTVWGKVDTRARAALGAAGEQRLVELLTDALDAEVLHVSEVSDGLGYDILAGCADEALHLEVKTTNRRGRLAVYLSRNEYEVMCTDSEWRLVAVLLDDSGWIAGAGTVNRRWIAEAVPVDGSAHGRWESVRLDVPRAAVSPGVEGVRRWLRPQAAGGVLDSGTIDGLPAPQWLGAAQ